MLVVISDLHLTDGSSGATISAGAFRIFAERLIDLAQNASWRIDGRYRPIERCDILLLGDVLDLIRSSRWTSHGDVRPWSPPQRPEFVDLVTKITADILRQNAPSLDVLRQLGRQGLLTIPPADSQGRPALQAPPQPVPVCIHYLVGNHDWMYHLPGAKFDLLRQTLVEHLGLANPPDAPFPHDPAECDELLRVLHQHKVCARHGDLFDPVNFMGDRDRSSLGDAVVVELLNRFAWLVETELAAELPTSTLLGLRELDNVRPVLLVPVWIDGLLERTCPLPSQRRRVKQVWDELVDDFLSLPFVRQQDTLNPFDMVDGLARALKFSKHVSLNVASTIIAWVNKLRGTQESSYFPHALAEQDFRNRRAKHIIYGHTHQSESVPLDASYAEGYVLNQMYFNSGTWRRVHRQTQWAPREHEFIAADVMTYLAFFHGDERQGRPYETWSGTLGLGPADVPQVRIDPVEAPHARGQQVSAPNLHLRPPHFRPPVARPAIVPSRRHG